VLELEVLIVEFGAVDGFSTCAIASCKISTLDHELLDHSVEDRSLVGELFSCLANAFLSRAESPEVLCGLGHDIVVQLESDSALLVVTNRDVEEDTAPLLFFRHDGLFFYSYMRKLWYVIVVELIGKFTFNLPAALVRAPGIF
jgi:hypothetical protein